MKKTNLLSLLFIGFFSLSAQAQGGFIQLGTYLVKDEGFRIISTSDGGYITAGAAGDKGVLYKTDCVGTFIAKAEFSISGPAALVDVTELSDGSLVAVGACIIQSPSDTTLQVCLFKTTAMLVEISSSNFLIKDQFAIGRSIAQTGNGQLAIWGDVTAVDGRDAFFQRIDPITLLPTANPIIFSNGVDIANQIIHTKDGNFLLAGYGFIGDFSDPEAPVETHLQAYKVNEDGALIWQANVSRTHPAKYGLATVGGVAQGIQSSNFMLGGNMFGGTDAKQQDLIFALISNDGVVLDTAYADAPANQTAHAIIENTAYPGFYNILADGEGSPLGVPSFAYAQAFETGGQLYSEPASIDLANPVSLRDLVEIDPGRLAYMGMYADNNQDLTITDIFVGTPEATVGIVFQNCALAAVLTTPAAAFQWTFEGEIIPNATQGVYFPTQPGLYTLRIIDNKGCTGESDTFRVNAPIADFSFLAENLTTTFTNASSNATTYSWNFGDGSTSTQSNPVHTYASNGVYTVQLIAKTNCGFADTLTQQVGVVSALEPSWLEYFSLSPNPTTGMFSVEMRGEPQAKMELLCFNSVGQLIIREELNFQSGLIQKTVDLSMLPAGAYALQIRSGKEFKIARVLKQ